MTKFIRLDTTDGKFVDLEFTTQYGFEEFYEKYCFVEEKLKDRGCEILIRSLRKTAKVEKDA